MNLQHTAQLGRQAAMEKTGMRWVSKLMGKGVGGVTGGVPKSRSASPSVRPPLSILPPKTRDMLRLRKKFPVVRNLTPQSIVMDKPVSKLDAGFFSPSENIASVIEGPAGKIGSKKYRAVKRHEVLHGMLANAEQTGGKGLPGMMRPAYKAQQLAKRLPTKNKNWVAPHYLSERSTKPNRWLSALLKGNPGYLTHPTKWGRPVSKWKQGLLGARFSAQHALTGPGRKRIMEGVSRILDEAGASYGGWKGRPITGAAHAAFSTFGPGAVQYGAQFRRQPLGLTQLLTGLSSSAAGIDALSNAIEKLDETGDLRRKYRRWLRNNGLMRIDVLDR